jgi:regulator of replication initiation timing
MSEYEFQLIEENRTLREENVRLRKRLELINKLVLDQRVKRMEDRYK